MESIIHYGFGTDYLKDWGLKEALREIYQNFLDHGKYKENVRKIKDSNLVRVSLSNDFMPENLDFLRIGNSQKKEGAIGKHGEGVKMAFMILQRHNLRSGIITYQQAVNPDVYVDQEIGECFCFKYRSIIPKSDRFIVWFEINKDIFKQFKEDIITEEDIEFTAHHYGSILEKPAGAVYSGGLFVAHLKGLQHSYDINPEYLPLDRDRSVPRAFDVNWTAGRILDAWDKFKFVDDTYDDTQYITRVPDHFKKEVKPVIVGSSVEFVRKDETGEEVLVKNETVKQLLKTDSLFEKAIKKLKQFVAKKLGLYDLLLEFREKHVRTHEARIDFDLILEQVENSKK